MKLTAYWTIVLKRIVDNLALQLQLRIRELVNKEIESELVNELMENSDGIQKMMVEPPSVAKNRERLQTSIELLRQSKETMEGVIHDIEVNG
ncbi:dynamin-related protein 4C-like protein, partial [Tanacetum coccineum]